MKTTEIKTFTPESAAAFLLLERRYATITLDEIKEKFSLFGNSISRGSLFYIKRNLTGFGELSSCSLCLAVTTKRGNGCEGCVWVYSDKLNMDEYRLPCGQTKGLAEIQGAFIPIQLLRAYRLRAKTMRLTMKHLKIEPICGTI